MQDIAELNEQALDNARHYFDRHPIALKHETTKNGQQPQDYSLPNGLRSNGRDLPSPFMKDNKHPFLKERTASEDGTLV